MNVLLWNGVEIFNLLYFLIMITTWKYYIFSNIKQ